jgi:23S rRNA maturation-related 3'-5' exoribonuclease YhaM
VSEILFETNSVLFDISNNVFEDIIFDNLDNDVNLATQPGRERGRTMASAPASTSVGSPAEPTPSNSDIMNFLKCLETKLNAMETRLNKLDSLEEKVLSFDKDMKF